MGLVNFRKSLFPKKSYLQAHRAWCVAADCLGAMLDRRDPKEVRATRRNELEESHYLGIQYRATAIFKTSSGRNMCSLCGWRGHNRLSLSQLAEVARFAVLVKALPQPYAIKQLLARAQVRAPALLD